MNEKICIVYTHHKLGDLIWQLPYIKAISEHHSQSVDLILREKTQAKNILKDVTHIKSPSMYGLSGASIKLLFNFLFTL